MNTARKLVALGITTSALLGMSALTRVSYTANASDAAMLRLSWHARGERIEKCRNATPEELAAQAAHMRQPILCEGQRIAPYRLTVQLGERLLADGPVAGSGGRGDGALFVLHESAVAPGAHRVVVRFTREAVPEDALGDTLHDSRRHTVPPVLVLDTVLTFSPRTVNLVTYAPELERLLVVQPRRAEGAAP